LVLFFIGIEVEIFREINDASVCVFILGQCWMFGNILMSVYFMKDFVYEVY
jgi:hypothetical protein